MTSCLGLISTTDHFQHPHQTYKVFSPLLCCLKDTWGTPLPSQQPSWPHICRVDVTCGVRMMPFPHGWGKYPPLITSYIYIRHIQSVWAVGMMSQGHMGAPLNHPTGQVVPRIGSSGSLVEWKWCHYVMFEADIHLRPLHTPLFDIPPKVFEPLICCLKGIWVHPDAHAITAAKLAPDL